MSQVEWKAAIAAAVLWTGSAVAQAPPTPLFGSSPAPTATTPSNMITIRTAGQPERKLQVLKTERSADGKYLTEVKDLASGAVFTIADTKPLVTEPVSASAAPVNLPGTTVPAGNLPQAKPRNADPLLANTPATLAGTTRARTNYDNATPSPGTTGQQSRLSAALLGSNTAPPPANPTLVSRFSEPKPITTQPTTSSNTPTLMGKLFGEKPTPIPVTAAPAYTPPVQPAVTRQPATNVIRPNAVPVTAPPAVPRTEPVSATSKFVPQPVIQPVSATKPADAVQPVALTPMSTDPREPNFHVVPVKAMTMKQIEELVKDLRMHGRPTQRIEAADALAKSPMAGMIEVRQILAEASYRDPDPVVRAHCIGILTKMQYDETNYKQYVSSLVNDEEPAVQRAARAAMK